jgi:hypothetical protein
MTVAGTAFSGLEIDSVSIVILGKFNPAIFHPQWFARFNLLGPDETSDPKIEITHRDISIFTAGWARVQVTQDQAILETSDPTKKNEIRDLARGTFHILEHTPLRAFGINTIRHYKTDSERTWHAVGDFFAPKAPWNALFDADNSRPGLNAMSISGQRNGCNATRIQIQIGPSERVKSGVCIKINQHYELSAAADDGSTQLALERFGEWLETDFEGIMNYSDKVAEHLWSEFRVSES